jgi:small subunit ribosomal protein S16
MLTIRMQRTGRKGLATFRVVVQDSRFTPTSGRVVAQVGHNNPHTKETSLDVEKIKEYLKNGAQPTPRVIRLLEAEKVKLPDWVEKSRKDRKSATKNTDKLRKNQPKVEEEPKAKAEEAAPESGTTEAESPVEPAEDVVEATNEKPAEDDAPVTEEKPADA